MVVNKKSSKSSKKRGSNLAPQEHDLQNALRLIFAHEQQMEHPPEIEAELPAIITHWLHNTSVEPLVLGADQGREWSQLLHNFSTMDFKKGVPILRSSRKPARSVICNSAPFHEQREKAAFTFIDLFAGIGGFRLGLQKLSGQCLFSSEWESHAKNTYFNNFGEIPFGDIHFFTDSTLSHVGIDSIPDHDILCGGFPCQPFSQAGNGLGFDDTRGTLFFEILKITKKKKPKALFLENVKRFKNHDKGRTFNLVRETLNELGYTVYAQVLSAMDFGLPQKRERFFIVAFKDAIQFEFPKPESNPAIKIKQILEKKVDPSFTITDRMWEGHQLRREKHRARGNGFGFSLFDPDDIATNTISARYWKDGSEALISQKSKNPRTLTPRECARLQGFPDEFILNSSKRHAYQQFGNSVPVPLIQKIGENILRALKVKKPLKIPTVVKSELGLKDKRLSKRGKKI